MSKLSSRSLSQKSDLSLLLISVNGALRSLRYASGKPGAGRFHPLLPASSPSPSFGVHLLHITHTLITQSTQRSQIFWIWLLLVCPHPFWSPTFHFHRAAREIIQNAKVCNSTSAGLRINLAPAHPCQPSFDLRSPSFSPSSSPASFQALMSPYHRALVLQPGNICHIFKEFTLIHALDLDCSSPAPQKYLFNDIGFRREDS